MKRIVPFIKNVIIQNISNPDFSVIMLAEILKISPSHLRDIINRHFLMSPLSLIESFRLEKAIYLLSENKSVEFVKRATGYIHSRTFRRVFKKRLQQTPKACRDLFLKKEEKKPTLNALHQKLWSYNRNR